MPRNELEKQIEELTSLEYEDLPDDISEQVKEALAYFSDSKERKRKAQNKDYQTELADTLLRENPAWAEVIDDDRKFSAYELECLGNENAGKVSEWWDAVADEEGQVHWEPSGSQPSTHQFYHDLYGAWKTQTYALVNRKNGILVNHRHREQPYEMYRNYTEFIEAVRNEEASFIYAGEFWEPENEFYRAILCQLNTVNAFVVDIDRSEDRKGQYFPGEWVMRTLLETFEKWPEIRPNYLCLSGTGIHLWYVFGKQIPLYRAKAKTAPDGTVKHASPRRGRYAAVSRALANWFADELPSNRFKVDTKCYNINHAYRAPGSPSKDGFPTRMFVYGGVEREMIDPLILSDFLGCPLRPYEVGEWNPELYKLYRKENPEEFGDNPATERQLETLRDLEEQGYVDGEAVSCDITAGDAGRLIREGMGRRKADHPKQKLKFHVGKGVEWMTPRDPKLYYSTLARIQVETPVGSREQALFALAGLGFLCLIAKEDVQKDMEGLLHTDWARLTSTDGKPLERKDIRAAMRGYNVKNATMHKETREDYLGWRYNPSAKRNHRKQREHLEESRTIRDLRQRRKGTNWWDNGNREGAPKKQQQVIDWRASHPTGTKAQCARDTGMSRTTVIKWWDYKSGEAEIAPQNGSYEAK